MASDFLDDSAPRTPAVERLRRLSLGAKLELACSALLFFSLFLTWQNLKVVYEGAGTDRLMLDGWDIWGLFIGFLLLGLVGLVLFAKSTDRDLWPDVDWELGVLVLAGVVLALVVVKNLTDRNSAWVSYVAFALAGGIVLGAFLDWSSERLGRYTIGRRRRRFFRTSA